MFRIYHPQNLIPNHEVSLSQRASLHCIKVLRLRTGDQIHLFCGDGHDYPATLKLDGKTAKATPTEQIAQNTESPLRIHLAQGLARNDRMDFIIQKAVECGVAEITPLITSKSVVKLKKDRLHQKMTHWENIVISACEQSGRSIIPILHEPTSIDSWLSSTDTKTIWFTPEAKDSTKDLQIDTPKINIILGPESGFSKEEIHLIRKQNLEEYSLGPRVLRTETATIAAITAVQSHLGDM